MKKLAGIILVAAVAWGGTTFVVGSKVEQEYRTFLDGANISPTVKLISRGYERSFFGASAQTALELSFPATDPGKGYDTATILFSHAISHGPLAGGTPALAIIDTRIESIDMPGSEGIFEKAPALKESSLHSLITLTGGTDSSLIIPPFTIQEDENTFTWNGLTGSLTTTRSTAVGNFSAPGATFTFDEGSMMLKEISATFDQKTALGDLMVGTTEVISGGMLVSMTSEKSGETKSLDLKEIRIAAESSFDGKNIAVTETISTPGATFDGETYGPIELTFGARNLNAQKLLDFQNQLMEQVQGLNNSDPDMAMLALFPLYRDLITGIMNDNPEASLNRLYVKTPMGEADGSLVVKYQHPDGADPFNIDLFQLYIPYFNIEANLAVDEGLAKVLATETTSNSMKARGDMSDEEIEAVVDQIFQSQVQMAEMQGFVVRKETKLTSHLTFSEGQLAVNGTPIPL